MGKISDAFERQRKEIVLKVDRDLEEKAVAPTQRKPKTNPVAALEAHDRVNGKLVVVSARDSADAENFRFLRSHIFSGKNGERPRTIMVTSAFPGEGKTFVATNLAASIAMGSDEQVLMVDCDLRRPNLHGIFGCQRSEGLCDYLDGRARLQDLITLTKIERLSLLSAGNVPACPGESISSSEMEGFMREIKLLCRNSVIVIDSCPTHITAGTRIIGQYVDGIVFVVMAQKWPRKEIEKSIDSLGREKILGVVFNGYAQARREYHKYYDHYYR